jgi:four helix bundle protein
LANELTWRVWSATAEFVDGPDAWVLRDRARAAARLVASSIGKGFEREDRGQLPRFLAVARASIEETRQQLGQAVERGLLRPAEFDALRDLVTRASEAIGVLSAQVRRSEGPVLGPAKPASMSAAPDADGPVAYAPHIPPVLRTT